MQRLLDRELEPADAQRKKGRVGLCAVPPGYFLSSAPLTVSPDQIASFGVSDKTPEVGDLVYGEVVSLGYHATVETREGRFELLAEGRRGVFVLGHRYAPDWLEGVIPSRIDGEVDLICESGIVGLARARNSAAKVPTRILVLGYVFADDGSVVNTRRTPLIASRQASDPAGGKLILVVGASMNSGKSHAAAACCWGLSTHGFDVRGSKITGSASLKEILLLRDAGARDCNDFSFFGYPSTYLLGRDELLRIFQDSDAAGANPDGYWIVELADGLLQRETRMLLEADEVRSRIHRLVFCAAEAIGCLGGLQVLAEQFDLAPHALSGRFSSSPLARAELAAQTRVPIFDSLARDAQHLRSVLA